MKKNLIHSVLLCLLVMLSPSVHAQEVTPKMIEEYQHDMDVVRLNDLKLIASYIEKYKQNKGNYPFQGEIAGRVIAPIATKEQIAKIDFNQDPSKPTVVHYKEFSKILEWGVDEEITLPFDPQRVFSGRQNFYLYMVEDSHYNLAVHLYHPYPFAQKIRENWYKVEVSNLPNSKPLIWDYSALMNNESYQKAITKPLHKEGFVEMQREKVRNEVGFN